MVRSVRTSGDQSNTPSSSSDAARLSEISSGTLRHYQDQAHSFFEGTRDHDVSQNIDALLEAIGGDGPKRILGIRIARATAF